MDNQRKIPDLQQESLKKNPFGMPEGYFESFSGRLQERIREEQKSRPPVRRIGPSHRFRVAMAAAILGLALITYPILKLTVLNNGPSQQNDVAMMEDFYLMEDDYYLVDYMENQEANLDDNEAFASQAIDYLAVNDVEMILLME
ncbi:MAG: hypothetical protein ACWGNV_12350 [Bacteroidales bacterium]